MKKIVCIALALVLALGMATTALATPGVGEDPVPDSSTVVPVKYPVSSPVHVISAEEENPNTGADVSASIIGGLVILGAASAFAISKKKK